MDCRCLGKHRTRALIRDRVYIVLPKGHSDSRAGAAHLIMRCGIIILTPATSVISLDGMRYQRRLSQEC